MKMVDWDTACFSNFKDVVKHFHLEDEFKNYFGTDVDSFCSDSENKYEENKIINHCLSWIEGEPSSIWFSGYNEDTGLFDINRMVVEPKNVDDAKKLVDFLNVWIYKNY